MDFKIVKHRLQFKRPSGTSRGVLRTKDSWIVKAPVPQGHSIYGEASIIGGLNPEDPQLMDKYLKEAMIRVSNGRQPQINDSYPSIKFAIEVLQKQRSSNIPFELFDNSFTQGETGIPINGLIWMGEKSFMFDQIKQKIEEGYTCIKLKIGAIDFQDELDLLTYVRRHYSKKEISLRVDANGAFHKDGALEKLNRLSDLDLHSIEQPIKQGQWEHMAILCDQTPLPIALDEELIGVNGRSKKLELLSVIKPHYIILKPSLVGGWSSSEEWIELASDQGIAWWATSALESNIGLNAIAQWVGSKNLDMPQGLGTGGLYTNNIPSPLYVKDAQLWYDLQKYWDLSPVEFER